jgi:hypothetical protein
LEVSYILPTVLPPPQESALVLCPRQVSVTPPQPLGCPNHQHSIWLSYLGPCTELTWSSMVLAWAGPFSFVANWLDLEFIVGHRDGGFPHPWGHCNKTAGHVSPEEGVSMTPWVMSKSQVGPHVVRNIFKILGRHKRETQYNSEVNRQGSIYFCRRVWHR